MASYRIKDEIVERDAVGFDVLLASIYRSKERPACLCREGGIPMYVVCIAEKYHLKRMPNTGGAHDPACSSYAPPTELSGLGQMIGSAIIENPDLGTTALKLDFSLSKSSGRAMSAQKNGETTSVRTDGNKLTIRALLHYLWEEAGFHKWSPSMNGKRNWTVIRKYLLLAAAHKNAKGSELADLLYIPEPFAVERKEAIAQRRVALLSRVVHWPGHAGPRQLMLLMAEVKEIGQARYGYKLIVKQAPDFHFLIDHALHQRLTRHFDIELGLWDAIERTHLMTVATFSVNHVGVASIEEIGLMLTTEQWIPFENRTEKVLIDGLISEARRFVKGMRYNLPAARPLATAVLLDTPLPTPMYLQPIGSTDDYAQALNGLIRNSNMVSWIWRPNDGEMPALPACSAHTAPLHNADIATATGPRHAPTRPIAP